MTPFVEQLVEVTLAEWEFFGRSTRSLADRWRVVGEEFDPPFIERVNQYWRVVGRPTLDGESPDPWSGAFISFCFEKAGAGRDFPKSAKHSVYVDRIRRAAASKLRLADARAEPVGVGDLIWNSRRGAATSQPPRDHGEALARLEAGDFFDSHVDIVVAVDPAAGACESVGGNVSNRSPGGSVTRSTWMVDAAGRLVDPRKTWIGVVRNGL
ncbi:MAG: DUF2272 domain-containing protein [Alphaproteobacteria bacterium]